MLLRRLHVRFKLRQTSSTKLAFHRHLSQSPSHHIKQLKQLPNWDLETFRRDAFDAHVPAKLPRTVAQLPPACDKWFTHDGHASRALDLNHPPQSSELRSSFWSEHESTIVPLELTTPSSPPPPSSTPSTSNSVPVPPPAEFHRTSAPLKLLLSYLANPPSTSSPINPSIYLAQCDLNTLSTSLQHDIPTPALVTSAGKGDIYASSLWLGRPPTYTPLHRDPNPNLFVQLAGRKTVRLLPPEVGDAVFDEVQQLLGSKGGSGPAVRGEEMMVGSEREILHRVVWGGGGEGDEVELVARFACEVRLGLGEALFIPKGWWHSVKGVGDGVTASVNWWFR